MDDEIKEEYLFWNLIFENIATMDELCSGQWSLDDVEKANAILDMKNEVQVAQNKRDTE